MTPREMIDVTLKHILPPFRDDTEKKINVSQHDGIEEMFIPYEDQARLFVQFFYKAVLDQNLQEVVMLVGLSFFRVANIQPVNGKDNRYICEDYVRRFTNG